MFVSPGTRAGRGESAGFFRKGLNRMFGLTPKRVIANIGAGYDAQTVTALLDAVFGSTRGMLLRREASAWNAFGLGSTGQAVISDGTDAKWGNVGGGSGGGLVFVGSASVTGAAATTLTISGLDLDSHQRYFIWVDLLSASVANVQVSLYFNSDTTAANYDVQSISANGSTISASRANNAIVFTIAQPAGSNGATSFVCWLQKDRQNRPRSTVWGSRDGTTAIVGGGDFHLWRTAGTNITGITLSASSANTIDVGSQIVVFRLTTT